MNDLTDAGYAQAYSDPQAVIVGAGAQAYVLRYNRNLIGVIDTVRPGRRRGADELHRF